MNLNYLTQVGLATREQVQNGLARAADLWLTLGADYDETSPLFGNRRREVMANLHISGAANDSNPYSKSLPGLYSVNGDLTIEGGGGLQELSLPNIYSVRGDLEVYGGGQLEDVSFGETWMNVYPLRVDGGLRIDDAWSTLKNVNLSRLDGRLAFILVEGNPSIESLPLGKPCHLGIDCPHEITYVAPGDVIVRNLSASVLYQVQRDLYGAQIFSGVEVYVPTP